MVVRVNKVARGRGAADTKLTLVISSISGGTTSDEITSGKSDRIGIGHWAQDGIAARGFLIDYVSYREKKGQSILTLHLESLLTIGQASKSMV